MNSQKIFHNILMALEGINHHKSRALLTSLGIVFGVASVIAMLAIGRGAEEEILSQLKLLGTNNIIVQPIVEQEEGSAEEGAAVEASEKRPFSPGLSLLDALSVADVLPDVQFVSPEIVVETVGIRAGLKRSVKLVGVEYSYFLTSDFRLERGNYFSRRQLADAYTVCVIGQGIKRKFFPKEDPIGQRIKCGRLWLTVIGVLEERDLAGKNVEHLGIRDMNMEVYAPIRTVLLRVINRSLVTRDKIKQASRRWRRSGEPDEDTNYHQIDRMVVRIQNSSLTSAAADIISRMLQRRHSGVVDFQVIIPELLLKQERRTKTIFNMVLGAIASISLLVGGIGIMNIMLASVLERIKEIGIRMAVGATPKDIALQFLSEAVIISIGGGIVGIVLGFALSYAIEGMTGIMTIVTPVSVVLSFLVSISVGVAFGFSPARKASRQDPIVCLRYE